MAVQEFHHPTTVYNTRSAEKIVPLILDLFHPSSVVDLGCGNGSWLKVFVDKGVTDILGVDGSYVKQEELLIPREKFQATDLEKPLQIQRKFDLAICLEVGEHLPESSSSTLIASLVKLSDHIVFSAAIPGQRGDRHLNEQPPEYWQQLFQSFGYHTYDVLRPLIWEDPEIFWWYKQNIFVATRENKFPDQDENIRHLVHPQLLKEVQDEFDDQLSYLQQLDQSPRYLIKKLLKSIKGKIS